MNIRKILKIALPIIIAIIAWMVIPNYTNADSFYINTSNVGANDKGRIPVPTMVRGYRIYCIQHGGLLKVRDDEYVQANKNKTFHSRVDASSPHDCDDGDVSRDVYNQKSVYGGKVFLEAPIYTEGATVTITNQRVAYMLANASADNTYMAIQQALWAMGYTSEVGASYTITTIDNPNENTETNFVIEDSEAIEIAEMISSVYEIENIIADKAGKVTNATAITEIVTAMQEGVNEVAAIRDSYPVHSEIWEFCTQYCGGYLPDDAGFSGVLRWVNDGSIEKDISVTKMNVYSQLLTNDNAMQKVAEAKIEELQERYERVLRGSSASGENVTEVARINAIIEALESMQETIINSVDRLENSRSWSVARSIAIQVRNKANNLDDTDDEINGYMSEIYSDFNSIYRYINSLSRYEKYEEEDYIVERTLNSLNTTKTEIEEKLLVYQTKYADLIANGGTDTMAVAGALQNEGERYDSFYQELQETDGEMVPVDKTGETMTYIDREKGTYTVGPFSVQYLDGYTKSSGISQERVNFGEITSIEIYSTKYEGGVKTETLFKTIKFGENGSNEGDSGVRLVRKDFEYQKDTDYYYPKSNELFYIEIDSDKLSSDITNDPSSIRLKVNFDYIAVYNATGRRLDGVQYQWQWVSTGSHEINCGDCRTDYDDDDDYCPGYTCYKYQFKQVGSRAAQVLLEIIDVYMTPAQTSIWLSPKNSPQGDDDDDDDDDDDTKTRVTEEITMSLSGHVWEDGVMDKESEADGVYSSAQKEEMMKNIKVSLYEYDEATGTAKLATLAQKEGEIRTNPTLTDDNGYYTFNGVWPMGKYYIEYTYNGQEYQATKYRAQNSSARDTWSVISNAMEDESSRLEYNEMFSSIESYPNNYETTNSLGYGVSGKVYSLQTLKGYTLTSTGSGGYAYVRDDDSPLALLDDYTEKEDKSVTYNEGLISKTIREYMYGVGGTKSSPTAGANKAYPDEKTIYDQIVSKYESEDPEIRDKLQFIEDCKMTAMTGSSTGSSFEYTLYSLENLSNIYRELNEADEITEGTWALVDGTTGFIVIGDGTIAQYVTTSSEYKEGTTTILYKSTYGRQDNINLGLNRRTQADISLRKDVKEAIVTINGKEQIYNYDKRQADDSTWDITVRLDEGYYDTSYTREIQPSDYNYAISNYGTREEISELGKVSGDELEIYVKYRVSIRNQSTTTKVSVDELVDYYDEEYTFMDRSTAEDYRGDVWSDTIRSYIVLPSGEEIDIEETTEDSAYESTAAQASDKRDNMEDAGYKTLYLRELEGEYINPGEVVYLYLTFKVNKDAVDRVILDEDLSSGDIDGFVGKQNITEINGYTTMYGNNVEVPNVGNVGGTPAGLIDIDSTPGNFDTENAEDIDFETFEDDIDKAPDIRIRLYRNQDRIIAGNAWEDARNQSVNSWATTTANGIMENSETKINGVTVQLVEIMDNGTEYVWREFGDTAAREYDTDQIGGNKTINNGTGTGTKTSETPIINIIRDESGNKLSSSVVSNYTFSGDTDGTYAFKSFPAGNYVVRFIYGDTIRTVLVDEGSTEDTEAAQVTKYLADSATTVKNKDVMTIYTEGKLNDKSYNGQDYKSTIYQKGVADNSSQAEAEREYSKDETATDQDSTRKAVYDIESSDSASNISDARDIMTKDEYKTDSNYTNAMFAYRALLNTREDVIDYSDNDMTNHVAEVLASFRQIPEYEIIKGDGVTTETIKYTNAQMVALLEELMEKTQMTAESGSINMEIEYNRTFTDNQGNGNPTTYQILNLNLGLEERPKAQLEIEKEVENVKITLANKTVLFDASDAMDNVLWQQHEFFKTGYTGFVMNDSLYGTLQNIRNLNSLKTGLIQISMDEELMHGATIQITYDYTIRNIGESDYRENKFYYTGEVENINNIVTITPNQLVDYVANNLQFYAADNSYEVGNTGRTGKWEVISVENILNGNLVNVTLTDELKKYNSIITTSTLTDVALVPAIYKANVSTTSNDNITTKLVLTQLITGENEADDLTYDNVVEIVRTSNTVGRRMEYSVAGNQNPTTAIRDSFTDELDADIAEPVKILPPFGAENTIVVIVGIAAVTLTILIGGIIFIKRKVNLK